MHLGADESTPGVDPNRECYPAGQGVGAIHELRPGGRHRALDRRGGRDALDRLAVIHAS